ncbi:MAG: SDR family oxidoreductase [Pseudonocardiales bacterium]|nr:MAG: SDR family oxidoreductase [Pseudonocardiales bacterium]
MTSLFDLTGKAALVTGGSRGIGRSIALALAAAGAQVAINGRDATTLEAVRDEIESAGGSALVLPGDVTDRDAVRAVVGAALETIGQLDIVVNNAGGTAFMVPFADLRFEGWGKVMRLNVDSVVHVCQAVAPHLLERGSGSVINVASVGALAGTPALTPYGASKAAVLSLTRSLAKEWGQAGIRVNALCPGWTATDLNRSMWEDERTSRAMTANIPMGRWAKAEEMGGAAVFLASDASSYVTGQAIVVDGGLTA